MVCGRVLCLNTVILVASCGQINACVQQNLFPIKKQYCRFLPPQTKRPVNRIQIGLQAAFA